MSNVRWLLALLIGLAAACGAPSTAIAPGSEPAANAVGLTIRSITTIAEQLLPPLELHDLAVRPFTLVRSESGEPRTRQVLVGSDGVEVLRVERALDGALRLIAQGGVSLEGAWLSESTAVSRALRQLMRLGLEIPRGEPEVRSTAGRTLVIWAREVRGVPVPGDGTRVVLGGGGELVGLAIEESPLAPPPSRVLRGDAALRAALALLPSGAVTAGRPTLAWVLRTENAEEPPHQRPPRRLAWCVRGTLIDGASFELQFDAGSLALLGWDGAP
jgi:hypothetical protein